MSESRDKAVNLLTHYIVILMKRDGTRQLNVDSDTHTELAEIVDHIIDASVDAVLDRIEHTHLKEVR